MYYIEYTIANNYRNIFSNLSVISMPRLWTGYAFRQPFNPATILVDLPLAESADSTKRQLDLHFQGKIRVRHFHDMTGVFHSWFWMIFVDWKPLLTLKTCDFCWFFSHQRSWILWSIWIQVFLRRSQQIMQLFPCISSLCGKSTPSNWADWVKIRYGTTYQIEGYLS